MDKLHIAPFGCWRWNGFWRNEEGSTAIEYTLIASGIAVAVATVVYSIGDLLLPYYQSVVDSFT